MIRAGMMIIVFIHCVRVATINVIINCFQFRFILSWIIIIAIGVNSLVIVHAHDQTPE